jgi:hypothetical protein
VLVRLTVLAGPPRYGRLTEKNPAMKPAGTRALTVRQAPLGSPSRRAAVRVVDRRV